MEKRLDLSRHPNRSGIDREGDEGGVSERGIPEARGDTCVARKKSAATRPQVAGR